MRSLGLPELFIILFIPVIVIVPFWKIFKKAGFPGALSILMLFPLVNAVLLFVLAFVDWPALKGSRQST